MKKSILSFVVLAMLAALGLELEPAQALEINVLYNGPLRSFANLVPGPDRAFYGSASPGDSANPDCIFKLTTNGVVTILACFNGTNGQSPCRRLTMADDGNFYGTTGQGGTYGFGTAFQMTPDGQLTTLYNFAKTNGSYPSNLELGLDGNFYGTTITGPNGISGTFFRMTPSGSLTTLTNFPFYNEFPGPVTRAQDGNFYGTTYNGVSDTGFVFRVTPAGVVTIVAGLPPGGSCRPSSLTLGNDGRLYGYTFGDGLNFGCIFRVGIGSKPFDRLKVLVTFNGTNGESPDGQLNIGEDGNFYGTTVHGNTYGSLFKMTPEGELTALASFNYTNGYGPYGSISQADNGSFYGTTISALGGESGTMFRVDVPPDLKVQPSGRFNGVGTTATFTAQATGTRPLSYQWQRNGTNLVDSDSISGANLPNLTLANVRPGDAGTLTVVVTNIAGKVSSSIAPLHVLANAGSVVISARPGDFGGSVRTLNFVGVPNTPYVVQFSSSPFTGPWLNLSTNTAAADGTWIVVDSTATNASRFYRSVSTLP